MRLRTRICAAFIILPVLIISAYADTIESSFDRSDDALSESYTSFFAWDDDSDVELPPFMESKYEDALEALIKQLEDQGYELDMWEGSSDEFRRSGGKSIAAVALAEVGKERSFEKPKGSNSVFYNEWFYGRAVSGESYPWCAVFIAWCADQCGYIDSGLFVKTASVSDLARYLSGKGFSTFTAKDLDICGGTRTAEAGDIAFWRSDGRFTHCGIVTSADDSTISITQGNCGGCVCTLRYGQSDISGSGLKNGVFIHVDYPSSVFTETGNIQDTCYLFLKDELGMSSGGACGAMGNFQVECSWNLTAVGDGGTSFGLCQWHDDRWSSLKRFCASNGYDDSSLEGQLRFLEYELNSTESAVYPAMKSAADSLYGAKSAALSWAKVFERCTEESYTARQSAAGSYWNSYGG